MHDIILNKYTHKKKKITVLSYDEIPYPDINEIPYIWLPGDYASTSLQYRGMLANNILHSWTDLAYDSNN